MKAEDEDGAALATVATKFDYFTVEGEPGTWTTHERLSDAIERATELGVSVVWGVRYTVERSGLTGVHKRPVWKAPGVSYEDAGLSCTLTQAAP